jgi:dimethylhistidine N-methyltransferase
LGRGPAAGRAGAAGSLGRFIRDDLRHAAAGLLTERPTLPPWLFYDARGSALFERITEVPEYYLTRAERQIFETHAQAIAARAGAAQVVELGAGTATKTQILLHAIASVGACVYVPVDVSAAALDEAVGRIGKQEPSVSLRPVLGTHTDALPVLRALGGSWLLMFIGSSIGNYEDGEAVALLAALRPALGERGALLLGMDRKKDPRLLIAAYDDAAGVTAAFDKNLLVRLNRELGADFDLDRWRHEARWNEALSRIEMHLVSEVDQQVELPGVGRASFRAGASIHTESCHKYDRAHAERILTGAGFTREETFTDREDRFDLHLARVR